ncbi:unnamed protein product [Prorocentrum cordatum]|uniref:Uncharacterized protein n=1 Tax=Prorocentrum cordatum TaxID=2364126 RepID=A0ABN9Y836_9DINO|nr:unnamed protein product [Polarella glacialis]
MGDCLQARALSPFHQGESRRLRTDFPCGVAPDTPEVRRLQERILCTLQISAGCRLPELQEHAHAVALAMRSAVEELTQRQQERLRQQPQRHQQLRAGLPSRRRKENCSENAGRRLPREGVVAKGGAGGFPEGPGRPGSWADLGQCVPEP